MKILTQADRSFAATLKKVALRGAVQSSAVEKTVRTILQAVQRGGDHAVLRYTKQFDRVALKAEALQSLSRRNQRSLSPYPQRRRRCPAVCRATGHVVSRAPAHEDLDVSG